MGKIQQVGQKGHVRAKGSTLGNFQPRCHSMPFLPHSEPINMSKSLVKTSLLELTESGG